MVAIVLVYSVGYPVANSAALGIFSQLPKRTRAAEQGRFALAGSVARCVAPIVTGYMEHSERTSSFSFALILCGVSFAWTSFLLREIRLLNKDSDDSVGLSTADSSASLFSDLTGTIEDSPSTRLLLKRAERDEDYYSAVARLNTAVLVAVGVFMTLAGVGAASDWGGDSIWGWTS